MFQFIDLNNFQSCIQTYIYAQFNNNSRYSIKENYTSDFNINLVNVHGQIVCIEFTN